MSGPKKKSIGKFPRSKIYSVVQNVLPKGQTFKLEIVDSKIDNLKIVRVITPAWRTLRPSLRIGRVLQAASTQLTKREQDKILRFSVLTPEELSELSVAH